MQRLTGGLKYTKLYIMRNIIKQVNYFKYVKLFLSKYIQIFQFDVRVGNVP